MKKVIFIYPKKASFIDSDIALLSKKFIVIENTYNWKNKFLLPIFLFKQFFFLLKNIRSSNHIIVSFGGYWSVIPSILGKVFKKNIYIILHGSDCASFKEINYGNMRNPFLKIALRISYHFATKLLPVSQSLIYTENTYYSQNKVIKQGYKSFFKNNTTPYTVIHNGIETDKWIIDDNQKRKENRFITVLSPGQFILKGGTLILKIAKCLPEYEFIFIGMEKPESILEESSNVKFIGRQTPTELLTHYNKSKYYLQLSIIEGFGCALAEAMSCGCIPIVSNVNILPDIIDNTGYVLYHRNVDDFLNIVNEFSKTKNSIKARERIIQHFSLKLRQKKLYKILDHHIQSNTPISNE